MIKVLYINRSRDQIPICAYMFYSTSPLKHILISRSPSVFRNLKNLSFGRAFVRTPTNWSLILIYFRFSMKIWASLIEMGHNNSLLPHCTLNICFNTRNAIELLFIYIIGKLKGIIARPIFCCKD